MMRREQTERHETEARLGRLAAAQQINVAIQRTDGDWRIDAWSPSKGERWIVRAPDLTDAADALEAELFRSD